MVEPVLVILTVPELGLGKRMNTLDGGIGVEGGFSSKAPMLGGSLKLFRLKSVITASILNPLPIAGDPSLRLRSVSEINCGSAGGGE